MGRASVRLLGFDIRVELLRVHSKARSVWLIRLHNVKRLIIHTSTSVRVRYFTRSQTSRATHAPEEGGRAGAGRAPGPREEVPRAAARDRSRSGAGARAGLRRLLAAACASVPLSLSVSGCISVDGRPLL